MRYKSSTSWKLNHICLRGVLLSLFVISPLCIALAEWAPLGVALVPRPGVSLPLQVRPSKLDQAQLQNMGVLEMPLLWRMMTYVKSYQMHSKWNRNCNTCPCLQTNSYHWKKNCAGSLLDSVGYSHLNLLRTGSKKPRLQLLHSSPKTQDLARHTQTPLKPLAQFPPWIERKCPFGIKLCWKTSQNVSK